MNTREELIREIEKTPEPFLSEVLDFIQFLKAKAGREKFKAANIKSLKPIEAPGAAPI